MTQNGNSAADRNDMTDPDENEPMCNTEPMTVEQALADVCREFCVGPPSEGRTHDDACHALTSALGDVYEQVLRADRAELALRDADRRLARLLEMADAWERDYAERGVKAAMVAGYVRRTIRGVEFAP